MHWVNNKKVKMFFVLARKQRVTSFHANDAMAFRDDYI